MVSADGQWLPWIRFCLQGVVEQCDDTINRIDRLIALRDDYSRRVAESGGNARLHRIVEGLFTSPLVTIPQVKDLTDVTYPTAKSDIDRLLKLEILKEGQVELTPRIFFAPVIYEIAYGDT